MLRRATSCDLGSLEMKTLLDIEIFQQQIRFGLEIDGSSFYCSQFDPGLIPTMESTDPTGVSKTCWIIQTSF